ncbi:MAG: hypothetical protein ACK2UK_15375 [Candidatus Promineifilaceae bacterium]
MSLYLSWSLAARGSRPIADVAIDLAAVGPLQAGSAGCDDGEGGSACVIFNADNWDTPKTVTVTVLGPGEVAHQVSSADPLYNGLAVERVSVDAVYTIYMPISR